ncbi:MAG: hypothetical protein PHI88_01785 [Candidatus Pacebacteria bacterium]|jgi:hypothetical protein|nr:hypothetical protein [Candidatus Paceibacterota bacterium]
MAVKKCKAISVTTGKRCKNNALPGSEYCYVSAHQALAGKKNPGKKAAGAAAGGAAVGAAATWPFWKKALLAGGIALILVIAACLIPKIVWHMGKVTVVHEGNPENPVVIEEKVDANVNVDGELDLNHDGFLDVDLGNPPDETFKVEPVCPWWPVPQEPPPTSVAPTPGEPPIADVTPTPTPPYVPPQQEEPVYSSVPDDNNLASSEVPCGAETASTADHGEEGAGDEDLAMALEEPDPGL